MSADELRVAATRLRKVAEAAAPGPWRDSWPESDGCSGPVVLTAHGGIAVVGEWGTTEPGAAYIALVNPTVGAALADWLDKEADGFDLIAATTRVAIEIGRETTVSHSTHPEALAVARAINGGAS